MNKTNNQILEAVNGFVMRRRYLFVSFVHLIQASFANYLAFMLRFEVILLSGYLKQFLLYLPILLVIRLGFYCQAGLYKSHLRFSGIHDLIKIIQSVTLGGITFFIIIRYLIGDTSYPISIYILDMLLLLIISGGGRLSVRIVFGKFINSKRSGKRMLVVGSSCICEKVVRDMKSHLQHGYDPIGFIDEDPHNKGLTIHGVPIFGTVNMIPEVIEKYNPDEILVSMTSSGNNEVLRDVFELSKPFNVPIKKLPNLNDLLNNNGYDSAKIGQRLIAAELVTQDQIQEALALQKTKGGKLGLSLVKLGHITEEKLVSFLIKYNGISSMRSISLEDLLQRAPVSSDTESVRSFINGKSILVTGAGGSIGSELCRQIVKHNPQMLILLDRYENSLFNIDIELRRIAASDSWLLENNIVTVVGDISDTSMLEDVFSRHNPQIVFHAAAHKHVPLMEDNPIEAVRNNIFGSKNVIDAASKHNVEMFVTISTDKAVNPTSIMGATKRVVEFLTISMNSTSTTKFTTVRFGNVLGSNGSVVPLFKSMLKKGGPLTVTHPEIMRYFMLIPEAVQLVIQAAAAGNGGETFVLDMGNQVKIVDLAENLIRLSGFVPYKEIKIKFTGLRPGEKLYEELFDESEKAISTSREKLRIASTACPSIEDIDGIISKLEYCVKHNQADQVIPILQELVYNFKSPYSKMLGIASENEKRKRERSRYHISRKKK